MITFKDVSFYYDNDGRRAVDGVNLTIARGEFVGVLGRNGSGKSTLAKLMNALLVPTGGGVYVGGFDTRDEKNVWEARRRCGMVFQNPDNQIVATIVEDDVAFGAENLGVPPDEIRERVDYALAAVGMTAFKRHAPHMLSGGQKQRVAIAGVLAMKPDVLVLDESTAMLDPIGRKEVLGVAARLNKEEGITVALITHHMNEAAACSRVIVMDNGKIAMDGTPQEVFAYSNRVKALGLDIPECAEIAALLRQKGIELPEGILTPAELAEGVMRLCPRS